MPYALYSCAGRTGEGHCLTTSLILNVLLLTLT